MQAILFIGHGSREPEGNEQLFTFTRDVEAQVRKQTSLTLFETCFLELTGPTIAEGIERCVKRGATSIAVVPLMLFSAGHAKLHIPHELDEARARYPGVTFTYGRPIGLDPRVISLLAERLAEASSASGAIQPEQSAVLLVGRGSSDPDANSDLYKLARLIWEQTGAAEVETAFMGVTRPDLAEGLKRCVRGGIKHIYVLPYLLFTGVLIQRMQDEIAAFRKRHPDVSVTVADYLGFHPLLAEIVVDRVREAWENRAAVNCDLCQYRLKAMSDHHHHHDHHHAHGHSHAHEHVRSHTHSCGHPDREVSA